MPPGEALDHGDQESRRVVSPLRHLDQSSTWPAIARRSSTCWSMCGRSAYPTILRRAVGCAPCVLLRDVVPTLRDPEVPPDLSRRLQPARREPLARNELQPDQLLVEVR